MGLCGKLLVALPVLVAAGFLTLQRRPFFAGLSPLMHAGIPWGFEEKDIGDLSGKTYLVTGANAGLGFSTVEHLARAGATVHLTCRSQRKCDDAIKKIKADLPKADLHGHALELSDLPAVKAFGSKANEAWEKLDGLIANAGFAAHQYEEIRGVESGMLVNHVSHFVLINELTPLLAKSAPSTVVLVASNMHMLTEDFPHGVPLSWEEVNQANDVMKRYGTTKLANIVHANELDRRLFDKGITVNSCHPGLVGTSFAASMVAKGEVQSADADSMAMMANLKDLVQGEDGVWSFLSKAIAWHPRDAALTQVGLAVKPPSHGKYFVPILREVEPDAIANDADVAKRFWDFSEEMAARAL